MILILTYLIIWPFFYYLVHQLSQPVFLHGFSFELLQCVIYECHEVDMHIFEEDGVFFGDLEIVIANQGSYEWLQACRLYPYRWISSLCTLGGSFIRSFVDMAMRG